MGNFDELRDNVKISYDQLILQHIRGISIMINTIPYMYSTTRGGVTHSSEDKRDSLSWGVTFLASLITDNIKDKKFEINFSKLNKEYNSKGIAYYMDYFNILINLLARKGYLFEQETSGIVGVEFNEFKN